MALGSIPSLSPAVNFREIDLTGVVPNNPTSTAVIAGNFNWGPILEPVMVANETELVTRFGKPNASNTIDWHGASYFLKYSDGLYVVRGLDDSAEASTAVNATAFDSDLSWTPSMKKDGLAKNGAQGVMDHLKGLAKKDPTNASLIDLWKSLPRGMPNGTLPCS
jgi:hypothetical protein